MVGNVCHSIIPFLSFFFVLVLLYLSAPSNLFKIAVSEENQREGSQTVLTQSAEKDEKREETDNTYWIQVLIQVQEKLDAWLKSINERIESQDVSRIEVRFLEILRNILEWVKEKVDAKVESSKGKGPPKKRGLMQETRSRDPLLKIKG